MFKTKLSYSIILVFIIALAWFLQNQNSAGRLSEVNNGRGDFYTEQQVYSNVVNSSLITKNILSRIEGNKLAQYSFQQFERMVYSGKKDLQLLAIENLSELGIAALPLLLHLVSAGVDLIVKESAIFTLLELDIDNAEQLVAMLPISKDLEPLIQSLSLTAYSPPYASPYQFSTVFNDSIQYHQLAKQLYTASMFERRQVIESFFILQDDISKELLVEVLKYEPSEALRDDVYHEVVKRFPEDVHQWSTLALEDSSPLINLFAINCIEEQSKNIENYLPLLTKVLYSSQSNKIKARVINLLRSQSTQATESILRQFSS